MTLTYDLDICLKTWTYDLKLDKAFFVVEYNKTQNSRQTGQKSRQDRDNKQDRTKRITRAFELRTLPNETHQQFSARAKEIWRRAEIGKLDEEHLLAQTILHKYTGENHKEIRSKVLDSDTLREKQGLIVPADIDEIALRIEIEKHYNTEE